MRLADGNKPIEIGDTSYIYKGVYNPIYWIGKDPYRPRVETLVIKDGEYVYANIDNNIDNTPSDLRFKKYSVPGGSLDADSTKIEQAEAETNEEALIKVASLYHSGIQYYELYEPGFILKGGDTPLEYKGSITDLYVGLYDGEYDKSKVEPKDLDPEMAEHGGFHKIISIAKYLRREHIDALIASHFVNDSVKTTLRLQRRDIINESTILAPDNRIYHASIHKIDSFKPMSLDLGNVFDEPGWSTFCFGDYEYARTFGFMRALEEKMSKQCEIKPVFNKGHIVISMDDFLRLQEYDYLDTPLAFYIYTVDSSGLKLGIGNDPSLKEYTFKESGISPLKVDKVELSMMDLKEIIDISNEIKQGNEDSDNKILMSHDYQREVEARDALRKAISNGELQPGDNIKEYMISNGIEFNDDDIRLPDLSMDVDEPVFDNLNISNVIENKYPIECYGLPERKAYPMPDEKHVRSAIKFFNYVDSGEEKELASNINDKIKEFRITDINVGDNNRFKKYYKPIVDSYKLDDYYDIISKLIGEVSKSKTSKEKVDSCNKVLSVIRMLVVQVESGVFKDLSEEAVYKMVRQCYNTIEELSATKLEFLADKPSVNNELAKRNEQLADYVGVSESSKVKVLMEADDEEDDETATDYSAMADEVDGGEGDTADATDVSGGEADTDSDEEVTDYSAMVDEEGGDDEGADEPEETPDETATEEDPESEGEEGEEDLGEDDVTDYSAMADEEAGEGEGEEETGESEPTEDTTDTEDTSTDNTEENGEINNRYDNKELKNYFLLNSFLSMHETVVDVLDSVNEVILPTPEQNKVMGKVVKNLQSIKSFIENFIQFQFSNGNYAFNLYYYNILINALKINLKLLESVMGDEQDGKSKIKKED